MSDEAVVRVVLVDSTSGANRSATQSSTAGYSTPSQDPIRPDRLYRELVNVSNSINKGFKDSLVPVLRTLGDIRDILDRDYDYSEKDYRESTTQTSLLRMIGASLSGSTGAVGREITKGIGVSSADMQMVNELKNISANIRELKLSLSPEAQRKNNSFLGDIIKGSLLTLGVTKTLPYLDQLIGKPGDIVSKLFGAKTAIAEAGVATVEASKEAISPSTLQVVGDSIVNAISSHPGEVAALAVGAVLGGIMYFMTPTKEKEKSTNELLQEVVDVTKGQAVVVTEAINNQDNYLEEISENTRLTANATSVTFETANAILGLMPGYDAYGNFGGADALRMQQDDRSFNNPMGWQPNSGLNLEQQPAANFDFGAPVADSVPFPTLGTPANVPMAGVYNWADAVVNPPMAQEYQAKYRAGRYLSPEQKLELLSHGFAIPANNRLDSTELNNFLRYLATRSEAPQYFASGGTVGSHPGSPRGTDTVPAWLTPGETIIPRYMAGGGVVGYGAGALLSGNAQMLGSMASASTDPSDRIGKFGDLISSTSGVLGKINPILGAFAEGLGAGVKGIALMMSAINESADKYGEYSPAIAQAQAMVEIRQTMGDMRRAQEIGGDMARFVVAQGEMQQKFEEVKIKLLVQIVPAINSILESISNVMGSGDGIRDAILVLTAPLTLLANTLEMIRGIQQDDRLKEPEDPAELLLRNRNFDSLDDRVRGSWVPDR